MLVFVCVSDFNLASEVIVMLVFVCVCEVIVMLVFVCLAIFNIAARLL